MIEVNKEKVYAAFDQICKTKNYNFTYGTAGFRDHAIRLDTVMFTTGIIAAIRSITHGGKYTGVMITASHNPPQDNGVKIVEPKGDMLLPSWEPEITRLVNLASNNTFDAWFDAMMDFYKSKTTSDDVIPHFMLAHDSRESSPHLLHCLTTGVEAWFGVNNVKIKCHGLLTTPQLHFLTFLQRENDSVKDYNTFFQNAWANLYKGDDEELPFDNLYVDTANGIGSRQLELFIKDWKFPNDRIHILNGDYQNPSKLNIDCGADFVKTQHKLPKHETNTKLSPRDLYCSFDGDADRIVFYYQDSQEKFHLLDGDKISTLFAKFLQKLLHESQLGSQLKLGVVQTAYANGNSTKYITDKLCVPVSCTKTGVKHLHHEAQSSYDIGIYFEANGHGTILFSEKFQQLVKMNTNHAAKKLYHFSQIINQTVGDAIADMLGVLITLISLKWTAHDWDKEYQDLPNLLTKVIVPDRTLFETTDQERKLVKPVGLQPKIEDCFNKFEQGRSFVRASGTEDAVRIYCECSDDSKIKLLSTEITELVVNSVKQ
ncbi:phosphoacetylglucosamine mutase [Monosporozyma unispora]|nr:Phosphoacetylglucosamine Mutase [Kazachstania unispora]